jgi:hypothetical protein
MPPRTTSDPISNRYFFSHMLYDFFDEVSSDLLKELRYDFRPEHRNLSSSVKYVPASYTKKFTDEPKPLSKNIDGLKSRTLSNPSKPRPRYYATGVNIEKMDNAASMQDNRNWCWAASIKMILRYHGIPAVTQKDIVSGIHGYDWYGNKPVIPNLGGTDSEIEKSIRTICNEKGFKLSIRQNKFLENKDTLEKIKAELDKERPLILCYGTSSSSHAVVLTGLVLNEDKTRIVKALVRDPSPTDYTDDNRGRIAYSGGKLEDLIDRCETFFTIHIDKK